MAIDYRDQRVVNRNKPRRQSIGIYVFGIFAVVLLIFAAGFAGGWYTCWYRMKNAPPQQSAALPPVQNPPVPGPESLVPTVPSGQQPPLTFYETLPKGAKGVIGSGINAGLQEQKSPAPPKPVMPSQAAPTASSAPSPAPAKPLTVAQPPAAVPSAQPVTEKPKGQAPPPDTEKRFTVQVASVKNKAEAESLRNKLAAKGLNPMIIQVNIADKGVVFRVRAGRHMQQREAQELAAKLGSGAIAVPE